MKGLVSCKRPKSVIIIVACELLQPNESLHCWVETSDNDNDLVYTVSHGLLWVYQYLKMSEVQLGYWKTRGVYILQLHG